MSTCLSILRLTTKSLNIKFNRRDANMPVTQIKTQKNETENSERSVDNERREYIYNFTMTLQKN